MPRSLPRNAMQTASSEDSGPVDMGDGRRRRTVKWPEEADKLAEKMADDDGYTYKGRTHVNEWLTQIVKAEHRRRALASEHLLPEDQQSLLTSENATINLRKLNQQLSKKPRKTQ